MAGEGLVKAMVLEDREAISEADAVLKLSQTPTLLISAADIYARAGEDANAEKLTAQAASQRPDDQFLQFLAAPMIRAVIAMNHHDGAKAVELMKAAEPYDHASTESMYTRAAALLMAGRASEAAQEFQRVLDLKNANPADMFIACGQLGLARSYALQGEKIKARTAYQDFLGAWKDADPDLPLLKQVQSEYAKLQ
jgi:predicted Zn-dependent protease